LGFFTGGQLKKVSLEGVGPVTLADAPGARGGGFWAPDGTIIFPASRRSGLVKVSADGGAPEVLTTLDPKTGEVAHFWPELLPDGKGILFMLYDGSGLVDWQRIVVQSLELGERHVLARGCGPRYVPTGHLVFARAQTLYAVPFDLDRLEVKGTEVPVVSGVWTPGPYVWAAAAPSAFPKQELSSTFPALPSSAVCSLSISTAKTRRFRLRRAPMRGPASLPTANASL